MKNVKYLNLKSKHNEENKYQFFDSFFVNEKEYAVFNSVKYPIDNVIIFEIMRYDNNKEKYIQLHNDKFKSAYEEFKNRIKDDFMFIDNDTYNSLLI